MSTRMAKREGVAGRAGLLALAGFLAAAFPPQAAIGESMVSIDDLACEQSLSIHREDASRILLRRGANSIELTDGSRRMVFNGTAIYLNGPARCTPDGRQALSAADAERVIAPLLSPATTLAGGNTRTVVIDAGHGGQDTGARDPAGTLEKELTLDVARRLAAKLERRGLRPRLTRSRDRTLELAGRVKTALRADADLFISIHMNSAANPEAEGPETYVMPAPGYPSTSGENRSGRCTGNRHDARNSLLAYFVQRRLIAATGAPDRGVKRARFLVLRDAPCPAILLECGFMSHTAEAARLTDPAYREKLAEGIARGITDYTIWNRIAAGPGSPNGN